MLASMTTELLRVHLLQLTVVIAITLLFVLYFARKRPAFAFVLLMLAFAKCLLPPVLPSPTSFFAWTPSLAMQPEDFSWEHARLNKLRNDFKNESQSDRAWLGVSGQSRDQAKNFSLLYVLVGVWMCGVGAVLWPSYKRLRAVSKLVDGCSETRSRELLRLVHQVKAKLGIRQHIRVLESDRNVGPGCIGVLQPALVIPKAMIQELPDHLLRPILAHELIHTKRRDVLWGYVQFVAQVIWWFHPLVWWLGRQANMICERSVDAAVIRDLGCAPSTYAESLVSVLKFKKRLRPLTTGMQLSAAEVTSRRLLALRTAGRKNPERLSLSMYSLAAVVFACVFLPGLNWTQNSVSSPASLAESQAEILGAIQAGELDLAERALERVLDANPHEPTANLLMGFLKQAQGDETSALLMLGQAASHPETRSIAMFNCARLLANQRESDLALECLESAIDSGFVGFTDLRKDQAFQSLSSDPRFEKLCSRSRRDSARLLRQGHSQLSSSISQWLGKTTDRKEQLNALVNDQTVLAFYGLPIDAWSTHGLGNDSGYDAQVWIDAQGGITSLKGAISETRLRLIATRCDVFGNSISQRTTVSFGNGRIMEQTERSFGANGGWNQVSENLYQIQPALQLKKPESKSDSKNTSSSKNDSSESKDSSAQPNWIPIASEQQNPVRIPA